MKFKPTSEQEKIVKTYSENFNIKIEANAGCGKTSTCLFLAESDLSKEILILTFNRSLADESKNRFSDLSNVSISTVHGFIKSLYKEPGFDSEMLLDVLSQNIEPVFPSHFDVLILDEFEDFSPLMIKVLFKSLFFINKNAELVILGSCQECIYELFDSDIRFLEYCDSFFTDNERPWKTLFLSKSFRLTLEMELFINNVILHQPHFSTGRLRKKNLSDVIYWIGNSFKFRDWFHDNIHEKYRPEEIFILGPSVNKKSESDYPPPIVKLERYLSKEKYPVFVFDTNSEKPEDDLREDFSLTEGKTVISSFHSSKGCERDVVIVFNFDTSYFSFFATNYNPNLCSNPLYVALTRAKKKLILIQRHNQMFNFIDKSSISNFCEVIPSPDVISYEESKAPLLKPVTIVRGVTDIVRQLHYSTFSHFSSFYSFSLISSFPPCENPPPNRIPGRFPDTFEDVSDFNGNISTLYFEFLETNKIPVFSDSSLKLEILKIINSRIDHSNLKIPLDLFYTAQIEYVLFHRYSHRLIEVRNWILENHLDSISQSFYHYFSPSNNNLTFEKEFSSCLKLHDLFSSSDLPIDTIHVTGFIDIIDHSNKKIIEVKFVQQLLPHHFQQLFFYYVLINLSDPSFSDYSYEIINIKSGEVFLLHVNHDIPSLRTLFVSLVRSDLQKCSNSPISDESFFNNISSYFDFIRSPSDLHLDLSSLSLG